MGIQWLRLYDDDNNWDVMGKEKNAARKANRCEVTKTFRLHSTVAFQQPGAQLAGENVRLSKHEGSGLMVETIPQFGDLI